MFEDLIRTKKTPVQRKKINLISKSDVNVTKEFLEDTLDVLWDLEQNPCWHCGAEAGSLHKDSCLYLSVVEEIGDLLK